MVLTTQPKLTTPAIFETSTATPVPPLEERYLEQDLNIYPTMADMGAWTLGKCESPLMIFKIGISHSGTAPIWKSTARWIQNLANVSNSRCQSHIGLVSSPYGQQGEYTANEMDMISYADVLLVEES